VGRYARFLEATGHLPPPRWDYQRQHPLLPVVLVSAEDALAYCAWAGGFLLRETQWEAAAAGPSGRRYPWGEAWCGARDMGGCVQEWVVPGVPRDDLRLKGGHWASDDADDLRVAADKDREPGYRKEATGFRLAMEAPRRRDGEKRGVVGPGRGM